MSADKERTAKGEVAVAGHEVREADWGQVLKGFDCCSKDSGPYPEGNRELWSF